MCFADVILTITNLGDIKMDFKYIRPEKLCVEITAWAFVIGIVYICAKAIFELWHLGRLRPGCFFYLHYQLTTKQKFILNAE